MGWGAEGSRGRLEGPGKPRECRGKEGKAGMLRGCRNVGRGDEWSGGIRDVGWGAEGSRGRLERPGKPREC